MVDLTALRAAKAKPLPMDPLEILPRLPKPAGFNDLYSSQGEVLKQGFQSRNAKDPVVKLHTGGGKTLVGLLMCQRRFKTDTVFVVPAI